MTNSPDNPAPTTPDRDLLISRVVDGRATPAEWSALEALAAREPAVWRDLATAQRDQRALEMLVSSAGDLADSVNLPESTEEEIHIRPAAMSRIRQWGGWVAAATLALAFISQFGPKNGQRVAGPTVDPQPTALSADDYLDGYRNKGKQEGIVLGEVPDQVLLEMQPATDGRGYVVTIVRQFVERRHVNDVRQYTSRDERGNLVPNPVTTPLRGRQVR